MKLARAYDDATNDAGSFTPAGRSADEMARSLGVSRKRLLSWVAAGLVAASNYSDDPAVDGVQFELSDAALLRSLCDVDHATGRPVKLRATLDRLRAWLPHSREPVRSLTLVYRNGPLLVRLGNGTLADASGQFRFNFGHVPDFGPLGRLGPRVPTTPAGWHDRGVDQELNDKLEDAIYSYTQALLLGGPDVQVTFDLAYALAALGDRDRAIERYRQVVELDPLRQDAWINLGDLLLASEQAGPAIDAFRRALDLDPDDAAAHYNLADALDAAGQPARAALHWEAFLRLADEPVANVSYALARRRGLHPSHR